MITILPWLSVIQIMAISTGVGFSTLSIINFLVAIADGKISPDERKMMGIAYIILRVAMVLILISTLIISSNDLAVRGQAAVNSYSIAEWTLIIILFLNSLLMTIHLMPSKIGPALQASTWYALGIVSALPVLGLANFSLVEFFVGYFILIVVAIVIVGQLMPARKK